MSFTRPYTPCSTADCPVVVQPAAEAAGGEAAGGAATLVAGQGFETTTSDHAYSVRARGRLEVVMAVLCLLPWALLPTYHPTGLEV